MFLAFGLDAAAATRHVIFAYSSIMYGGELGIYALAPLTTQTKTSRYWQVGKLSPVFKTFHFSV
jgi:hypothetical protein